MFFTKLYFQVIPDLTYETISLSSHSDIASQSIYPKLCLRAVTSNMPFSETKFSPTSLKAIAKTSLINVFHSIISLISLKVL